VSERQQYDPMGAELRADALDVLHDTLQWRLVERRWTSVATVVAELARALRSGDVEAVRTSVYELELSGPVRATLVGDTPTVDAPEQVRVEINTLIFELAGADDPSGDARDR
jgi:CATRA-Associated Small Protein